MTFNNTLEDHHCDCLSKGQEIYSSEIYIRKLRKHDLEDKDFISHWEREIGRDSSECDDVCSYKGISVNAASLEGEAAIAAFYNITFQINPKKGCSYLKFHFKNEAGLVVHAPLENSVSHHNFYKSDEFSLGHITPIEVVKFA